MFSVTCVGLLAILSLIPQTHATRIKVTDCGSTGTLNYVDVNPCPSEPCKFAFDTNVQVQVNFTLKYPAKQLYNILTAQVEGESDPYPFSDPNACDKGVKCPVKPGEPQVFKDSLYIESDFPEVSGAIAQWEITNEKMVDVICFKFPFSLG